MRMHVMYTRQNIPLMAGCFTVYLWMAIERLLYYQESPNQYTQDHIASLRRYKLGKPSCPFLP